MKTARVILALLLLALAALHSGAQDKPRLLSTQTGHYLFMSDCEQANHDEFAKVVEAAWAPMKEFFAAEPKLKKDERLKVYFFEKEADWAAQIEKDGTPAPRGAGGYYWPPTRTAYLWRQPTLYNTRQLLLHEIIHQFHFLAKCNNTGPKDAWYTEGIAEYLSRHFWDGEKVTLGALPLLTLENYSERALLYFEDKKYDFTGLIHSTRASDRPEQWALVRFFITAEKGAWLKKWQQISKRLDAGESSKNCFRAIMGDPRTVAAAVLKWLQGEQEPFKPVFNEWEGIAPGVFKGWSSVTTLCHARKDAAEIAATLQVPEGNFIGGLLLHFSSTDDYTCAHVKTGGNVTVNRRKDGAWQVLGTGMVMSAEPPKQHRLTARRGERGVTFNVDGTDFGPFDLPGKKLGLCLENCTLKFTDVEVK